MSDPIKYAILGVLLAVLVVVVIPFFEERTGINITQRFFGIRRKKTSEKKTLKTPMLKKPQMHNGTKMELTAFVASLLRLSTKYKMRLVAPGTVCHKGKTARLTSLLVAPGGIIGVYCLGFGGTITPSSPSDSGSWRQHMNDTDSSFENPLAVCKEQYRLVASAMEEAGIRGSLKVVTVFTNPKAALQSCPPSVYTQRSFTEYIKTDPSLKSGTLDVEQTALALAELANIKKKGEKKH
ncbi:MAG: hypothetical protein HFG49_11330 [Lachnospiraceae bacterium]|jgi:hypothetical protein|nr:hypothetical protein [Lachnospiraceae bacterium]